MTRNIADDIAEYWAETQFERNEADLELYLSQLGYDSNEIELALY